MCVFALKHQIFGYSSDIIKNGEKSESYTEEQGQEVMRRDEILVRVRLARGNSAATVWTCDLSHEYVRINAEYRT